MQRIVTLPRLLMAAPLFLLLFGAALPAQNEEWQRYRELGDKLH